MIEYKLQPQAVELEEAVLGAMMLEKEAFELVSDILQPDSFYKPAHKLIFKAIISLKNKNEPIDILTVPNELKTANELELAGGIFYISKLGDRVASTANSEYHARIIQQKYLSRELIRISTESIKQAYEDQTDIFELLEKQEALLKSLSNLTTQDAILIQTIAQENIRHLREIKSGKILQGVYAGYDTLQDKIGGWQNSDLIIIAARPAMGKTALALSLALNPALEYNMPTVFFSLEMGKTQITARGQSIISGFSASNILKANLNEGEINSLELSTNSLFGVPLYIDDTPALSIPEFKRKARRLKKDKGVMMIVIDYLQLMTTGEKTYKGNREQEISYISRSLKATAKELNVPIIALSQLSRDLEKRGNKRPMLSDLRESGAIEQDADVVIFPFRPEYYGEEKFEDGMDATGKAEIIVAKNRNGALVAPILGFEASQTKFYDLGEKSNLQPNTNFTEEKF